MDFIESKGYCFKCKKDVITRRGIPELTVAQRILTLVTFGFWPLYLIRVGWKCSECGANADNEKVHIVARRMGGLRQIEALSSRAHCEKCGKETPVRRSLPPASSIHQKLSFLTAGAWPSTWIQTGWHCEECGEGVDLKIDSDFEQIIISRGFCDNCQTEKPIRRKVPRLSYQHKILSFFTAGSWPFYWLLFGWQCYQCGKVGNDVDGLHPKDYIEVFTHCDKCGQVVPARRELPKLNFMHRILALATLGTWPFRLIRSKWRCTQCDSKISPPIFEMDHSVSPKPPVEAAASEVASAEKSTEAETPLSPEKKEA